MLYDFSAEALTRQFYEWEMRGRGWLVLDYPVTLEPPFRRFLGHFVPAALSAADDGRRETGLSSFFDRLKPLGPPPLSIQEDREPPQRMCSIAYGIISQGRSAPSPLG